MGTESRQAVSKEMEKSKRIIEKTARVLGFDEHMLEVNWKKTRKINNFVYGFLHKEKGVTYENIVLGGVPCMLTTPKVIKDDHIFVYIHGGAFVLGSAFVCKGYCSMLANYSGRRVIAIEYALAPEHPYPAGVNDCFAAYEAILEKYPNSKIALFGESAGGSLVLVTALKARNEKKKMPSCIVAHSPVTDFSGQVKRGTHTNIDLIVRPGCSEPLKILYVGNADPNHPYVSPICGDFTDFPPLFLSCDYNESLNEDAHEMYRRVRDMGGKAKLVEMKDSYHAFGVLALTTPEMQELTKDTIAFVEESFNNTVRI